MTIDFARTLSLTPSQEARLPKPEQNFIKALKAREEQLRQFRESGESIDVLPGHSEQLAEIRKLDLDIRNYLIEKLNLLAEESLSAGAKHEVGQYIRDGAADYLKAACARVNPEDLSLLDTASLEKLVNEACSVLVPRATARYEQLKNPKAKKGAVPESNLVFHEFPRWKHHLTKQEVKLIKSAEEEWTLGGGWGDPDDVRPYKGPRVSPDDPDQVITCMDKWQGPELPAQVIEGIEIQLVEVDASFWNSPEESVPLAAMKLAFDGIASVLFDADILTRKSLEVDIPGLVWAAAIAGGWYRFAGDKPKNIFPERVGCYFLWRDETTASNVLFRAETAKWRAALHRKSASGGGSVQEAATPDTSPQSGRVKRGRPAKKASMSETSEQEKEGVAERAARRQAFVLPLLDQLELSAGGLATKAGLGPNSVYEYLDGTRKRITPANRNAIAGVLGINPKDLPR